MKRLPLRKISGPRISSHLCTKHVPATLLEQYLKQLSVRIVDGRAKVAQELHNVQTVERNAAMLSPAIAAPQCGTRPGMVIEAAEVGTPAKVSPSRLRNPATSGLGTAWPQIALPSTK